MVCHDVPRKIRKAQAAGGAAKYKKKRSFAIGGGGSKHVSAFTRQLSILQDAGLPILRSLKILENNAKAGKLKNALMDVCDEIETGSTLSEALSKSPKLVHMINGLTDQIYRFRQIILKETKMAKISNDDHKQMLDFIRKRDADGVEALVRDHIARGQEMVLEEFDKNS